MRTANKRAEVELAAALAVVKRDKGKKAQRRLHSAAGVARQVVGGNKRFTPPRTRSM